MIYYVVFHKGHYIFEMFLGNVGEKRVLLQGLTDICNICCGFLLLYELTAVVTDNAYDAGVNLL